MGSANNLIDIQLHNQEVRSKIATNDREESGLHAPKCPTHFQRVNIAVKHPVNVAKIVLFSGIQGTKAQRLFEAQTFLHCCYSRWPR